jgi:hypothetical protein
VTMPAHANGAAQVKVTVDGVASATKPFTYTSS